MSEETVVEEVLEELPVQDELTALKKQAKLMGIKHHPAVGVDKLRAKVKEALSAGEEAPAKEVAKGAESISKRNTRLRAESAKLVRVNVSCMNPNKREWDGEILTVSNSIVGTHRKFVKFNTEDGYHVPNIIYQMLVDRKYQSFYTHTLENGQRIRKGKIVPEFNVQVLPPLTKEELAKIAQRQAAARSLD